MAGADVADAKNPLASAYGFSRNVTLWADLFLLFIIPKENNSGKTYFSQNSVSHSGFPAPGGCAERMLALPCLQAWGCSSSGCQKSAGCRQAQCI